MSLGDILGLANEPNFLPKYHGDEGDTRYPSPRALRRLAANLIDLVLAIGSVFVTLALMAGFMFEGAEQPGVLGAVLSVLGFATPLVPVLVIGGNWILLPYRVHATVGGLIFGLVRIRGSDGAWPGRRDLAGVLVGWYNSDSANVPHLVTVRRCDVRRSD